MLGGGSPRGTRRNKMAKKVAEKKVEKKVAKKVEKKPAAKAAAKKVAPKKAMTKGEIIANLSEKNKQTKKQIQEVYESLVKLAAGQVKECGEFTLPGLGKLCIAERAARTGRNPRNNEPIEIPAKKVVKMTLSKSFSDEVIG